MEVPVFHILLVADDPSLVQHLVDLCLKLGHRPLYISNRLNEVDEVLMYEPVDIVLLHQDLPEASLVAVLVRNTHEIPLVWILNAASGVEVIGELMGATPQGFIEDSIGITALQGTLWTAYQQGILTTEVTEPMVTDDLVLDEALKSKQSFFTDCMFLPVDDQLIKINYRDILYVKSDNVYVEIYTKTQTYLFRSSLTSFLAKMPADLFFRTHKSYGVNLQHIEAVNHIDLLIQGQKIPISKTFKQFLLDVTR